MNSTSGSVMLTGEFTIVCLPSRHPGLASAAAAAAIVVAFARSIDGDGCGNRMPALRRLVVLVGLDPGHAVAVGAVKHVGGAHGLHLLRADRVHDRRGHAGAD